MGTPTSRQLGDVLDQILATRSRTLEEARQLRPVVFSALQGSYHALVDCTPDDAVGSVDRALVGLHVSAVQGSERLVEWFTEVLEDLDADAALVDQATRTDGAAAPGDERSHVLLSFAAALASRPANVAPDSLDRLRVAGLDDRGVVVTCQLVAFTSYLARVVAGLQAAAEPAADAVEEGGDVRLPGGFSLGARRWTSHLPLVSDAAPEVWAALTPDGRPPESEYLRTLAHDPTSLVWRSRLYDEIMYGEHGLDRADRELVALVVSMVNGCEYCASVHSRRLAQLTKSRAGVAALLDGDPQLVASPRRQALVRMALDLTATPPRLGPDRIAELRRNGLTEPEIFDALDVAAIFAWANRLMLVLGHSEQPAGQR